MAGTDTLTDRAIKGAIKAAAAGGKARRISDGRGLYFEARPTGAGWWRFRFVFEGREGMLSLGTYPDVPLVKARARREDLRRQVADGIDPSQARKDEAAAKTEAAEVAHLVATGQPVPGSFEAVARHWFGLKQAEWAPSYAEKVIRRLETLAFPYMGRRPIAELEPPELLAVLRRCESRGNVETAHRLRDTLSLVFRFAVIGQLIRSDPARDLAGGLQKHTTRHIPAITDPGRFGELLRAIDAYRGTPTVRAALLLAALVFLRPGSELRCARWAEFDLDAAVWLVPAARLKRNKDGKANGPDHLVPLSRQAVAILRDLHPLTGRAEFVFQGMRNRRQPVSDGTLNAALTGLGFGQAEHRAHGFRASARTLLHERLGFDPHVIEAQLGHSVPDALGRAYNRTQFAGQRRALMQRWADYLDELRTSASASEAADKC